jgi:CRISPR-associated exonuclease Cas4
MMGDRDFRSIIKNSIDSLGRELEIKIDVNDLKTIHLKEVVQCLRRSYYDRIDPKEFERRGFSDLLSGLLRKLQYGSEPKEFEIEDVKLKGQADMIADDLIILFRPSQIVLETPRANDLLYLNACMWIYNKTDGIIIYITGDSQESTFSLTRDKKMFEEIIRRVKVLNNLLKERKTPILEPSNDCSECQYYQRCFITKKNARNVSLAEMLGLKKEND